MRALFEANLLTTTCAPDIGASSVDLTLSEEVFCFPDGAVKPSATKYHSQIEASASRMALSTDGSVVLEPHKTYLVKLNEHIQLLKNSPIYGQATAKSSVGRIDVLARLVVDGMNCYEYFDPKKIGNGDLYLELTPLTFRVRIKAGIALSQLRLFYGQPDGCLITVPEAFQTFLKTPEPKSDGILSVDLEPELFHGHKIIGFRAKPEITEPIPLWKHENPPNPWEYWDFVLPESSNRLSLKKGLFYILKSKERLALPHGVAVYCRASDESFGEMRIHYAGFAHPMFGRKRYDNNIGTPLIFEVRGHDVNVSLGDGESMARLQFYRMSKDASDGDEKTDYENQTLKLSGFFPDWPQQIEVCGNGEVHPTCGKHEGH